MSLVLGVILAQSAVRPASALTMEDALRRMLDAAPQIAAQREQWRLASIDRWRRFLPNEPQLLYGNADDHTQVYWGLGETFSFPGRGLALRRLDRARESAQRAEWFAKRHELARLALQVYLDGAVASTAVDIQKRNIGDLEALAQTLRARYEAGLATQAEDITAELQLRQQRADLVALEDRAASASRQLRRLLAIPDAEPVAYELPDDLASAIAEQLRGETADVLRARAQQELADASRRLAWWNQLPDVGVSAVRNRYYYLPGSPSGAERTWTYGANITLPLLFPAHEAVEARRARSQAEIDLASARLLEIAAETDVLEAAREYSRSRARLQELRGRDIPMAEALLESALASYKAGKLGFAELVLARKTLADIRGQDVQLRGAIVSARLRCLDRCVPEETRP